MLGRDSGLVGADAEGELAPVTIVTEKLEARWEPMNPKPVVKLADTDFASVRGPIVVHVIDTQKCWLRNAAADTRAAVGRKNLSSHVVVPSLSPRPHLLSDCAARCYQAIAALRHIFLCAKPIKVAERLRQFTGRAATKSRLNWKLFNQPRSRFVSTCSFCGTGGDACATVRERRTKLRAWPKISASRTPSFIVTSARAIVLRLHPLLTTPALHPPLIAIPTPSAKARVVRGILVKRAAIKQRFALAAPPLSFWRRWKSFRHSYRNHTMLTWSSKDAA